MVGLKATYGRVPFLPQHAAWSCVHNGFLASMMRDQAIGYMAIAGYDIGSDDGDAVMDSKRSLTNPPVHLYGFDDIDDLNGLRIGIYWDWFMDSQKGGS